MISPGLHAIDGSYTELVYRYKSIGFKVTTASDGADLVMLIEPLDTMRNVGNLIVQPSYMWGKKGEIVKNKTLIAKSSFGETPIYVENSKSAVLISDTIFDKISLLGSTYISTGKPRTKNEIAAMISASLNRLESNYAKYNEAAEAFKSIQTILAWNAIYDPEKDRMITPVSRLWNYNWGGYVLFCWDNYFASYMYSTFSKEHAFANAIEITNEITESGFIPNFATVKNVKSRDRSQPPVGSIMVREIYRKFPEKWFLEETFDKLLAWNRWWPQNRDTDGLLCWGSTPFETTGSSKSQNNNLHAAKLESGLDNSPMYDNIPYDTISHQMKLGDVGLMSLYIADCKALADIAGVLKKSEIKKELLDRAEQYNRKLTGLWSEEAGIFLNKRTDNHQFSSRISPTNFYPLLSQTATQKQAEIMMQKNFYNPQKFWGEWIMPSISRDDSAYYDNEYWRGRIWSPMNFLVYLGMCNYDLPQAKKDLSEKSMGLVMNEWLKEHHIHENYNAENGDGDDVQTSDVYYHWGALGPMIYLIENKYVPKPLVSIEK